ncbi:hypothetical protein RSOLAG22IIIB_06879 [Rhizoctonia solani]|uniref:Hydrophobin n=1 Tax=Rhizoctonia solani TaxID=456999 RepID=A0A0K6GHI2_9AGAM|nr:hypothetical protein RSOLAG22IIIB_06879 [Rhizoctonia solani]
MRTILSLVVVAGFAVASPTPLTPSSRQTAYDLPLNVPTALDLSDIEALSGGSGLLGANSGIAGLHLRHVKRGLLGGLNPSDVGGTLGSPTKGGALPDLGLGVNGDRGENRGFVNSGLSSTDSSSQVGACSTGRRYCCKYVRKYTDPRNVGLLDSTLPLDASLNNLLVGFTCDLITGSLAPGSCAKHAVCCTGQQNSKQGILNLGCAPLELSISN